MRRPWWLTRPRPEDEDVRVLGERGEGRVLVVTMRDVDGEPVEKRWMTREQAQQWDHDTRWQADWR